jgi:L-fucose isomerase-like protein
MEACYRSGRIQFKRGLRGIFRKRLLKRNGVTTAPHMNGNLSRAASGAELKVGVVRIGRKRPGFDQQWNEVMSARCLEAIGALGHTVVGADALAIDDESMHRVLNAIRQADVDVLLVLQPSMGHGQLALTLAQNWADPVVLWPTPERQESEIVSSCSLVAHHLWASIFAQAGHAFEVVNGDAGDAGVRAQLAEALALCSGAARLRSSKIGLVGTHAPGFIDLAVDPFVLLEQTGVQVHPLSLPQFIDRVRDFEAAAAKSDMDGVLRQNLEREDSISEEDLLLGSKYVLAMKQLIEEEHLDALAVQCWPELPNVLGQWPYLAMSRLADQGEVIAMEGDCDGALTSLAGKLIGAGTGFITDWLEHDERTIHFWHPGMAAMSLQEPIGSNHGPRLAKHFNIQRPLVVDGQFRVGEPMTVARLWKSGGKYHVTAFEGQTIAPRRIVTGNAAHLECTGFNINEAFDDLIHEGLPHHVVLFYGNHAARFRKLARLMKLHWVAI